MNRRQRLNNILIALMMFVGALVLLLLPDDGYLFVLLIFCIAVLVKGIKGLIYYFSMARHMVGGKMILYESIILTDIGIFVTLFADIPKIYAMLLLVGIIAFDGVIDLMRAFEEKRLNDKGWKIKLSQGVINMLFALFCLFYLDSGIIITTIYSVGLIYGAGVRLINALKRTSVRVEKL